MTRCDEESAKMLLHQDNPGHDVLREQRVLLNISFQCPVATLMLRLEALCAGVPWGCSLLSPLCDLAIPGLAR